MTNQCEKCDKLPLATEDDVCLACELTAVEKERHDLVRSCASRDKAIEVLHQQLAECEANMKLIEDDYAKACARSDHWYKRWEEAKVATAECEAGAAEIRMALERVFKAVPLVDYGICDTVLDALFHRVDVGKATAERLARYEKALREIYPSGPVVVTDSGRRGQRSRR